MIWVIFHNAVDQRKVGSSLGLARWPAQDQRDAEISQTGPFLWFIESQMNISKPWLLQVDDWTWPKKLTNYTDNEGGQAMW